MKVNRLIGILSILLQQEKVTAPYLSDKFEVSRRTINRDIEDLCMAGIPIVTTQGRNGGISIMDGFCIDKTVLTTSEMQSILSGLRGLDSVAGTNRYQMLMDKLSFQKSSTLTSNNHIIIDLSSHKKNFITAKIELLQTAIDLMEKVTFNYYSPNNTSLRIVEPYLLLFQWSSWYLWGYCDDRADFRLFKLNRMQNLTATSQNYSEREMPPFSFDAEKVYPKEIEAQILFEPEAEWVLVDEFGTDSYEKQENGKLLFRGYFTDSDTLFQFILRFGEYAVLLKPQVLVDKLKTKLDAMTNLYISQ